MSNLANLRKQRAKHCDAMRAFRACRNTLKPGSPGWKKVTISMPSHRLPSPNRRSLLTRIKILREFSCSSWQSRDTEYYSACGHDDYESDRRHEATLYAWELFEIVRELRNETNSLDRCKRQ